MFPHRNERHPQNHICECLVQYLTRSEQDWDKIQTISGQQGCWASAFIKIRWDAAHSVDSSVFSSVFLSGLGQTHTYIKSSKHAFLNIKKRAPSLTEAEPSAMNIRETNPAVEAAHVDNSIVIWDGESPWLLKSHWTFCNIQKIAGATHEWLQYDTQTGSFFSLAKWKHPAVCLKCR